MYHLWKHYENCQKYTDRSKVDNLLRENLEKVRKETKEFKMQAQNFSKELVEEERSALSLINNNILDDAMVRDNHSGGNNPSDLKARESELTKNIYTYRTEVDKLKKEIDYMKDSRNDRVYEVKLQLEREGREEMEERARELVLNNCDDAEQDIMS